MLFIFYLTPNKVTGESKSWYSLISVGRNCLGFMLKDMCAKAEVAGNFMNHSLKAYGATTLQLRTMPIYQKNLFKKELVIEALKH